jgi:hypothetical protein
MVTYFNIENGTCLLRRIETPGKLGFELLTRLGKWKDDASATDIGVRYTVGGYEIEADEISESASAKVAQQLGGSIN